MGSSSPASGVVMFLGLIRDCMSFRHSVNSFDYFLLLILIPRSRLKWKSAEENSVDFKLELRFPPLRHRPEQPDTTAKPVFVLSQWLGGDNYEFFDTMYMSDDDWEKSVPPQPNSWFLIHHITG